MGLAASQARLLLLTARKSDLEFRAQMISQSKTLLAMQTEQLALNYSNALNNRALFFTFKADSNNGTTKQELLTYDNLTATSNTNRYRIVTQDGKVLARSTKEANEKYKGKNDPAYGDGDIVVNEAAFNNPQYLQDMLSNGTFLIQEMHENTTYSYTQTVTVDGKEEQKVVELTYDELSKQAEFKDKPEELKKYADANKIVKFSYDSPSPVSGMEDVASRLDDTDDAQAAATYEYQSLIIQNRDKQLDVELKQIETQQKACESEIDSVKKILQTNVEKSFKTFS